MLANEDRLRVWATDHFLSKGLGSKLTRDASMTMQAITLEPQTGDQRFTPILACGSILERICWICLGQWLGYFHQEILPLSTQEKAFLSQNSNALRQHPWPDDFSHLLTLLLDTEIETGTTFFSDQIIGSALPKNSTELRSVFQAAHIISEDLTEAPMRILFRFLYEGDIEDFNHQPPLPEKVIDWLRTDYVDRESENDVDQREAVIAGFINYTEFLSAMDSLLPSTGRVPPKGNNDLTPEEKLLRAIFGEKTGDVREAEPLVRKGRIYEGQDNRELLADEIKDIIRWRISDNDHTRTAYDAAQSAFSGMVSEQFERYPSSGLYWPAEKTQRELGRLSSRFFGFVRSKRNKVREYLERSGEREVRATEMLERLREKDRKGRVSGSEFAAE